MTDKNTKYIYKVVYGPKSKYKSDENYDVIKKVFYLEWSNFDNRFTYNQSTLQEFATGLYYGSFTAKTGRIAYRNPGARMPIQFTDIIEVIAYKQEDGEIWIKSKPDSTILNNLSLLEISQKLGIAEKEESF